MRKTVQVGNGPATNYLHDGFACVSQTTNGIKTNYFVPGTSPLWESTNNQVLTYAQDGRGNITGLWTGNNYAAKFNYDAFGNVKTTDANNNPLANTSGPRYGGQFHDANTDQIYLRNRYYDPKIGAFNRIDPIGFNGGLNLYGYCAGDPVNASDPMGLKVVIKGARWDGKMFSALLDTRQRELLVELDKVESVYNFDSWDDLERRFSKYFNYYAGCAGVEPIVIEGHAAKMDYRDEKMQALASALAVKEESDKQHGVIKKPSRDVEWEMHKKGIEANGGFPGMVRDVVVTTADGVMESGKVIADADKTVLETGLLAAGVKSIPTFISRDWSETAKRTEQEWRAGYSLSHQIYNRGMEQLPNAILMAGGLIAIKVAPMILAEESVAGAKGVVYKRVNPKTGEVYVGQAENFERFLARQNEHNTQLGLRHDYTVLERVEPGLELNMAEETWIRKFGGPVRQGGSVQNKRYQMNEARYRAYGGTINKPTE
jgi:RHS repeat-associated protein